MSKAKNKAAPAADTGIAALDAFKATPGTYQVIDIHLIQESPFNPRKTFNEAALGELAESIKEMGVIQPIRVRPRMINATAHPDDGQIEGFEVIFGHRRFRAAKLAGEKTIPAMVSDLSDAESARLQAVENLQREDLDPIEEAEGYADYIREHGVTKDKLGEHISKSRTYVYNRLKLATLCEYGRQFVRSGTLAPDLATDVARLPTAALQMQALHDLATTDLHNPNEAAEFMSYRDGQEVLERKYKRHLDSAIFDRQVIFLVPDRPGCADCPDRAGNIPELEATGKRADVCTVPDCFAAKTQAHLDAVAAAARSAGGKVIEAKDAVKLFDAWGDKAWRGHATKDLLALDQRHWRIDGEQTVREALGKKLKPKDVVHVVNPYTGKVIETVELSTLVAYKVVAEEKPDGEDDPDNEDGVDDNSPKLTAEEQEARRAADFREKSIVELMRPKAFALTCELMRGVPRQPGDVSVVLYMFMMVAAGDDDGLMPFEDWLAGHNEALAEQWEGWMQGTAAAKRAADTWEWVNSLDGEYQGRLLVEIALLLQSPAPHRGYEEDCAVPDVLMMVARSHGVDEAKLRAQAEAELDQRAAEAAQGEENDA